ncbi:MAG TPA: VOC family protein [Terriglobia bacterium]|nr:VOC family protein [Terriglobia bacterium]
MKLYIFRCKTTPRTFGATRYETASNLPTDTCSGGWEFYERIDLAARGTLRYGVDTATIRRHIRHRGWHVWQQAGGDLRKEPADTASRNRDYDQPRTEPEVPGFDELSEYSRKETPKSPVASREQSSPSPEPVTVAAEAEVAPTARVSTPAPDPTPPVARRPEPPPAPPARTPKAPRYSVADELPPLRPRNWIDDHVRTRERAPIEPMSRHSVEDELPPHREKARVDDEVRVSERPRVERSSRYFDDEEVSSPRQRVRADEDFRPAESAKPQPSSQRSEDDEISPPRQRVRVDDDFRAVESPKPQPSSRHSEDEEISSPRQRVRVDDDFRAAESPKPQPSSRHSDEEEIAPPRQKVRVDDAPAATSSARHQVVWFDIPVRDIDRAVRFYSAVLGIPLKKEQAGPGAAIAALPHAEGSVGGSLVQNMDAKPSESGPLLYLNADGRLDDALMAVESHGGKVLAEKHSIAPFGFRAIVVDCEGNRIALHSM